MRSIHTVELCSHLENILLLSTRTPLDLHLHVPANLQENIVGPKVNRLFSRCEEHSSLEKTPLHYLNQAAALPDIQTDQGS